MNTKLATTQLKIKNWALIIKEQKKSGLNVKDYCSQHNISKDAYYYWYKKVKEVAFKESSFVDITHLASSGAVASACTNSESFEIQCRNIKIILPISIPKATLSNLVEVLAHVE